ncbi:barstar family protein [Sphingomonas sp. BT-65]|uniref:barstar family protein n=1 Tax=Sphingomonas sp. BT-65 TaxID=2989821 RepID=UPI002235B15A|nr:barstar family protein [Sphingomonas sp. BT-65]MCW4460214.1 barstar family protein [Sphingomonas sp. BT-65]
MAMRVHLDGDLITTEAEFHSALRDASGIDWYGGNLDALFDLLVGVVDPPIELHWTSAERSRAAIGERFDRIVTVILDAVAERGADKLRFTLEAGQ